MSSPLRGPESSPQKPAGNGCRAWIRSKRATPSARRQKREEASAVTFKDCAEQLMASHEAGWRNPAKHAKLCRHTLRDYAYPIIGDLPVTEVDTELIMQVPNPIWTKMPETASRVRSRLEAVLDWAKVSGFRNEENTARWRGHPDHLLPARSKVRRVSDITQRCPMLKSLRSWRLCVLATASVHAPLSS